MGKDKGRRIPFVSTYSESSPKIGQIIRKHWGILKNSFPQIEDFQSPPVMAYRQGKSLKDTLVRSDVSTTPIVKQVFWDTGDRDLPLPKLR